LIAEQMLPYSRQDPSQRGLVSSARPPAEVLVGREEALSARGGERNTRFVSHPIQVVNKGRFVVVQHCHHLGQITVVWLVSVPPLASIAAAHCGQMALVTTMAFGDNPAPAAC
jgi:hypothetical protein